MAKRWPIIVGLIGGAATTWWLLHRNRKPLSGLGGASGPIRTIQLDLQKIGVPVQPTGVLDDATVTALNQIFEGSVDVPARLATGRLTKHDIAREIPVVVRALKVVVHGAKKASTTHVERISALSSHTSVVRGADVRRRRRPAPAI